MTGQQDRHPGNFLVDEEGAVTLIDHGCAFSRPGDLLTYSLFQESRVGDLVPAVARDALRRLLADPTTAGLEGILRPDRAAALRARAQHRECAVIVELCQPEPDALRY